MGGAVNLFAGIFSAIVKVVNCLPKSLLSSLIGVGINLSPFLISLCWEWERGKEHKLTTPLFVDSGGVLIHVSCPRPV